MPTNISTIVIDADKQKVWDAVTKPGLVKLWQYGSDLETTWAIGSSITFTTEWQGQIFKQWGSVLAFEPASYLSYNMYAPRPGLEDKPGNYFVMKYVLTDIGGRTQIEIIQEDNRPGAIQEEPKGDENPVLQALKNVAENN